MVVAEVFQGLYNVNRSCQSELVFFTMYYYQITLFIMFALTVAYTFIYSSLSFMHNHSEMRIRVDWTLSGKCFIQLKSSELAWLIA